MFSYLVIFILFDGCKVTDYFLYVKRVTATFLPPATRFNITQQCATKCTCPERNGITLITNCTWRTLTLQTCAFSSNFETNALNNATLRTFTLDTSLLVRISIVLMDFFLPFREFTLSLYWYPLHKKRNNPRFPKIRWGSYIYMQLCAQPCCQGIS